jgi:hypothetical protein
MLNSSSSRRMPAHSSEQAEYLNNVTALGPRYLFGKGPTPTIQSQPALKSPIAVSEFAATSQTAITNPARNSPYSTGLKPEAVDKLPPIEAHRILSKPAPQMSEAAEHFHMLKMRLDHCLSDRQYDDLVYSTECRLREQAAYLIGYLA